MIRVGVIEHTDEISSDVEKDKYDERRISFKMIYSFIKKKQLNVQLT